MKGDKPLVTVVMPVRNEARTIGDALTSVLAQDYPMERMEILIADGASEDGTAEIARRTAERLGRDGSVRVLDNPGRIVSTGLNRAIAAARGDVIVRVDGHCEIAPTYVRRCVELLASTGADNVGGLQRARSTGAIGRAIAAATSSRFGVGNARFHYATEPGWADTVYLGSYRREVFDRIGGFDEELVRNQDDELNMRLRQAGGRIWLDPSIESTYRSRSTVRALWRQYFGYGMYKVLVAKKRRAVPSVRSLVPPAFVVALGVAALFALVGAARWPIIVIAGGYAVATVGASLIVGARDAAIVPVLPLAFATMHTAYGSGFTLGLARWGMKRVSSMR